MFTKRRSTLIIIAFMLVVINSINALDPQLPQICGGDDQLLIGCIGDEEITFLAGLPVEEGSFSLASTSPDYVHAPTIIPVIEEPVSLEKINLIYFFIIFIFGLLIFIFFVKRRKRLLLLAKDEEEEEKKDEK